jgi:radical SAM superfamily enzyme YgiQ (UPF0313 family)
VARRTRVALINPPNTRANVREEANAVPPLGLAYIAATLRADGFPADLFDLGDVTDCDSHKLSDIGLLEYDVYGLTSYTKTFAAAREVAQLLRHLCPLAKVVFGGPHVTPCAAEVLSKHLEIDCIICNDGERPMLALCRHLELGIPRLTEIGNLVFRSECGSIIINPEDSELVALDELPFPVRDWRFEPEREVIEHRRQNGPARTVFMSSSRGCPKRCTFCSIIVMNPKYRFRSVASLLTEIKELHAREPWAYCLS